MPFLNRKLTIQKSFYDYRRRGNQAVGYCAPDGKQPQDQQAELEIPCCYRTRIFGNDVKCAARILPCKRRSVTGKIASLPVILQIFSNVAGGNGSTGHVGFHGFQHCDFELLCLIANVKAKKEPSNEGESSSVVVLNIQQTESKFRLN